MPYKKHNFIGKAPRAQKVNVLESKIHVAIADYLNMVIKSPSRWHTVEVSNQASGRAAMFKQMALKRKGVKTGWPDIELFWFRKPWGLQIVFLEVKVPGKNAEPHQERLHEELRSEGHLVYVVHSVDEVEEIFRDIGVI